jgi:hypothetical protein
MLMAAINPQHLQVESVRGGVTAAMVMRYEKLWVVSHLEIKLFSQNNQSASQESWEALFKLFAAQ